MSNPNDINRAPSFSPSAAALQDGLEVAPRREFALAPLTIADMLDETFQLLKACWREVALAVLVYAVPQGILSGISDAIAGNNLAKLTGGQFFGTFDGFNSASSTDGSLSTAVSNVAGILEFVLLVGLLPFVSAAIVRIVASRYLNREMTAREAFRGLRPFYWTFVGATILVGMCVFFGVFAFIVGAPVIAVLLSVVTPIIAIEEENVGNAIGRSWALMKRRFWTYLTVRFFVYVLARLAGFALALAPLGVGVVFYFIHLDPVGGLFFAVGEVLASLITVPISAIGVTMIYFDARVRQEGFDLQMMAARLPQTSTSPPSQ